MGVFLDWALRFSLRRRCLSTSSSCVHVRAPAAAAAASCRPRYTLTHVGAAGPTPSSEGDNEGYGALGEAARAGGEGEGGGGGGGRVVLGGGVGRRSGQEGNLGFGLRELCMYTCVGGSIVVALGLYPTLLLRSVAGGPDEDYIAVAWGLYTALLLST